MSAHGYPMASEEQAEEPLATLFWTRDDEVDLWELVDGGDDQKKAVRFEKLRKQARRVWGEYLANPRRLLEEYGHRVPKRVRERLAGTQVVSSICGGFVISDGTEDVMSVTDTIRFGVVVRKLLEKCGGDREQVVELAGEKGVSLLSWRVPRLAGIGRLDSRCVMAVAHAFPTSESALYRLSTVTDDALAKGVEQGDISPATSVQEIEEWAATQPKRGRTAAVATAEDISALESLLD